MKRRTHILVAESSVIIRSGIISVLKRLNKLDIDIAETGQMEHLLEQIASNNPDILIVNPVQLGFFSLQKLKSKTECPFLKIVALQTVLADSILMKNYDQIISIYDNARLIQDKLLQLIETSIEVEDKIGLSMREQEIVIGITKGLGNKQIADQLCISTHTVMAHRRNITAKLQIHSPAGLTIYAIVNKLIDISEIQDIISPTVQ